MVRLILLCNWNMLGGGPNVPRCPSLFHIFIVNSEESAKWAVGTQHCDGSTGDNEKQTALLVM